MAYKQSGLNNIGDIRDRIVRRKLNKKFGSEVAAEKFKQIEDFRSRAAERNQPKFKTMETSFKTSIKPFEKETIKFDIPEKEKSTKKSKIHKSKIKTKKGSGGVIREKSGIGKQALITLGAVGGTLLAASPIFGIHRSYGMDKAKNLGGN
tara:strand:- start:69 stop:518 length:450 start_codon:yes stop_codon:yes gene_type:complete